MPEFTEGGEPTGSQLSLFDRHIDGGLPVGRANHSARPDSKKAETMNDISFRTCYELFRRSNHVSSWQKTFAASLVSNLDKYSPKLSHHWKAKVTKSLRFVFLLVPSKPRIEETDCGLWEALLPTPDASRRGTRAKDLVVNGSTVKRRDSGQYRGIDLQTAISMLPTPRANDPEKRGNFDATNKRNGLPAAIKLIPTPTARDYRSADMNPDSKRFQQSSELNTTITMIATPRANDYKGSSRRTVEKGRDPISNSCSDAIENNRDGSRTGLKLQPAFALWMMGFPEDWCDLSDGGQTH